MFETLLSAGLFVVFFLVGSSLQGDAEALLWIGVALGALGFGFGLPTAFVYHWRLYRSLRACGRLPRRWWLHPTALHDRIPHEDRPGVLIWGAIGGAGFGVIVLGLIVTSIGVWRTLSA